MSKSYDRLADVYIWLEYLAFGCSLVKAREYFLTELKDARSILILGEGDGRFLKALLKVNPTCHIDIVDSSLRMIEKARRQNKNLSTKVQFIHTDALTLRLEKDYDAIVTLFFLDNFDEELELLINKLSTHLKTSGMWYHADFHLPEQGVTHWRNQIWLNVLYTFFGWQTDICAKKLVNPLPFFLQMGLRVHKEAYLNAKLVHVSLLQKTVVAKHSPDCEMLNVA